MRAVLGHVLLPAVPTALIIGLYFTPVSLIGCVNRGLLAFAVAVASLTTGFVMVFRAIRLKMSGDPRSAWFALSGAILAIPAALLLGPLG